MVKDRRSILVKDLRTEKGWGSRRIKWRGADFLSELDVPLLDQDQDRVLGVFNFESRDEGAFSEEDQAFVEKLAKGVVLAVKRAKAQNELNQMIMGEVGWEQLLDLVVDKAIEETGSDSGGLALYDEDGVLKIHRLTGADHQLPRGEMLPLGQGLVQLAASSATVVSWKRPSMSSPKRPPNVWAAWQWFENTTPGAASWLWSTWRERKPLSRPTRKWTRTRD